jgi:ER membrane protein complex subunit 2
VLSLLIPLNTASVCFQLDIFAGFLVLEQVYLAALDCHNIEVADSCLTILGREFPQSLRVRRLLAMRCEALGDDQMALNHLEYILNEDKTNVAARKRIIAMYKAKGNTAKAISELAEYLKVCFTPPMGGIQYFIFICH